MESFTPQQIYAARSDSARAALGSLGRHVLEGILEDVVSIASESQDPQASLQQIHAIVTDAVRGRRCC